MLSWILEHWQLLVGLLLALVNFIHTWVVHNGSKQRLSSLEKDDASLPDTLAILLDSTKAILEALNEKKNQ